MSKIPTKLLAGWVLSVAVRFYSVLRPLLLEFTTEFLLA